MMTNRSAAWEGALQILTRHKSELRNPVEPIWQARTCMNGGGFLDHLLRLPADITAYNRFGGAAVDRRRAIRQADVLSIQIPLPPLEE